MKSEEDCQMAHDILLAVVTGEVPFLQDPVAKESFAHMAGVLCWVLGHHHSTFFEECLAHIDAEAAKAGMALRRSPTMFQKRPLIQSGPGKHRCDNCGQEWEENQLAYIRDFFDRVEAGGTVPSGECPDPECGALCYPVAKPK